MRGAEGGGRLADFGAAAGRRCCRGGRSGEGGSRGERSEGETESVALDVFLPCYSASRKLRLLCVKKTWNRLQTRMEFRF